METHYKHHLQKLSCQLWINKVPTTILYLTCVFSISAHCTFFRFSILWRLMTISPNAIKIFTFDQNWLSLYSLWHWGKYIGWVGVRMWRLLSKSWTTTLSLEFHLSIFRWARRNQEICKKGAMCWQRMNKSFPESTKEKRWSLHMMNIWGQIASNKVQNVILTESTTYYVS